MRKKTKPRKQKRSSKPLLFVQNHGTLSNETLVAIGATGDEMVAYLKRIKANKGMIEWVRTWKDSKPSPTGWVRTESEKGWTVLWLRAYEDTWDYWEVMIHELSHLMDFVMNDQKSMQGETEARAYQAEYLFRSIRRKIQGLDK